MVDVHANTVTVSFKLAGLASGRTVYVGFTGNAEVTMESVNNGGHHPPADNKSADMPLTLGGYVPASRNGSITGTFAPAAALPSAADVGSPPGQHAVLRSVLVTGTLTEAPDGLSLSVTAYWP